MTTAAFVKADSSNLPAVDTYMLMEFMKNSDKHNVAEIRGAKALSSSRDSYVESAIGYIEINRAGGLCTVRAKVVPEHRLSNKYYVVMVHIDETGEAKYSFAYAKRKIINVTVNNVEETQSEDSEDLSAVPALKRKSYDDYCLSVEETQSEGSENLSADPATKRKSYDGGAENSADPFSSQYAQDWEFHDDARQLCKENEENTNIDTQRNDGENETEDKTVCVSVGTQSEFMESKDNLREANTEFGLFVARELSNVPLIKRRQVMWQIIKVFEHSSV